MVRRLGRASATRRHMAPLLPEPCSITIGQGSSAAADLRPRVGSAVPVIRSILLLGLPAFTALAGATTTVRLMPFGQRTPALVAAGCALAFLLRYTSNAQMRYRPTR